MARLGARIKLVLQLLPVLVIAVAGIYGAAQLKVVREFLAGASGEPANIVVDNSVMSGTLAKPWKNFSQGGEMSNWQIGPIRSKVTALDPDYIRLDHIYSFYDIVGGTPGSLTFNFSKLDPLIDGIVATGAKPYISLSYMPAPISETGQIIDKPKRWEDWQETVRATIQHYSGDKKIANVVYEVWNEPDLFGGWKPYGDKNYLTLYNYAARGQAQVRNAQPYLFGGPATTALYKNWFDTLTKYVTDNNLRMDFFSWHRYNLDVDVFRKDMDQAITWKAANPALANLQLHITEFGPDSNNNPGYDTSMSAAHTAATSIEMIGKLDRAFVFEVEDGKDPKGQEHWGRWGVLTNQDFGANIKPRYLALRLMNRIDGNQIQLLGKGSWVKAVATRNKNAVEMLITNYDRYSAHTENVPVTFKNIPDGSYIWQITDMNGSTRKLPLTAANQTITTTLPMGPNSVMFAQLLPQSNQDLGSIPTTSLIIPTPSPALGPADALRNALQRAGQ